MIEFIDEVGDATQPVIIKSDQEPSIEYHIKDVVAEREEGRTIVEESPVKSSGSNGIVERAVQSLEGQLRVLLPQLVSRAQHGRTIDAKEPIVTLMPEYARAS